MTLIIGVKCEDGIVVGADSIATYGTPTGIPTIEQEMDSKITVEASNVIVATSGAVGLSQQILAELHGNWNKIKKRPAHRARNDITKHLWSHIGPAMQRANLAQHLLGPAASQSAICASIIVLPLEGKPRLLQFVPQADSEECTKELPMVALGSGQPEADPFLAFIKRIFWNNSAPKTIPEGIFGVLWTLQHVSRVKAGGGVGGKASIAVLEKQDSGWAADKLDEDRLAEHLLAVAEAESLLKRFRQRFNPDADGDEAE